MVFSVPIESAKLQFPDYEFISSLTPSAQKCAFHVRKGGQDFCLKIIAPNQSLERVQREVLAMQSLQHPNVVRVIEYEYSARAGNSRHYLVEQFIAGNDLSMFMLPGQPWTTSALVRTFVPICDGLTALQAQQIVHRDLKPSNIRIRANGDPVIVDFGLARLLDMESLTLTHEGAMIGTPRYFSPEQFKGTKRDIDHRTDLYALGVIIFEAAVGQHPSFNTNIQTMEQLTDAVCTSESFANEPAFQSLPNLLKIIVKRLLQKERARRPADASIVAKVLRDLGEA